MKRGMAAGFVLAIAVAAPTTAAAPETVTLEFDQMHSWGAENSGDSVMIRRLGDDEVTVEVDPVNETCGIDDDLGVGESFSVYIRPEGSAELEKCDYRLLRILAAAAEFAENCTGGVTSAPRRC